MTTEQLQKRVAILERKVRLLADRIDADLDPDAIYTAADRAALQAADDDRAAGRLVSATAYFSKRG